MVNSEPYNMNLVNIERMLIDCSMIIISFLEKIY